MEASPSAGPAWVGLALHLGAYLLPFGLLITALVWLTDSLKRRGVDIWWSIHRNRRLLALILLAVIFLLLDVPYLVSRHLDISTHNLPFWLQTIAGNWSPPDDKTLADIGPFWHAFSATAAILLNNTLYVVIITLVWRAGTRWRRAMDIAAALRLKDSFTRTAVQDILEDRRVDPAGCALVMGVLDAATQQAQADLEKHLPNVDRENAMRILAILRAPSPRRDGASRRGAAA